MLVSSLLVLELLHQHRVEDRDNIAGGQLVTLLSLARAAVGASQVEHMPAM